MRETQQDLTRNYLTLCYDCTDAHRCDTEEQCLACWQEQQADGAAENEAETTEQLLAQYAE